MIRLVEMLVLIKQVETRRKFEDYLGLKDIERRIEIIFKDKKVLRVYGDFKEKI